VNELERKFSEVSVAYFKVYPGSFLERLWQTAEMSSLWTETK